MRKPTAALDGVTNLHDLKRAAGRSLPRPLFDIVDGAADDEQAAARNLTAWSRIQQMPRVGVDVSTRDQSVSLFGVRLDSPVVLAPTGLLRLFWPKGDHAATEAAVRARSAFVMSTVALTPVEELASMGGDRLWFQLYVLRDRGASTELIQRLEEAGVRVLYVTMDVPVPGNRERDVRSGFSLPIRYRGRTALSILARPAWAGRHLREVAQLSGGVRSGLTTCRLELVNLPAPSATSSSARSSIAEQISGQFDPSVTWDDIESIRRVWPHSLVVKGIMSPDDARAAVSSGADGVVVSNHGGRQLASAPATASVLPRVAEAVDGRTKVLVDGGIRRGTDVLAALSMGADAVQIGRPYLYGLAAGGSAGVELALDILRHEIDRAMAFLGISRIGDMRSAPPVSSD